jgi:pimeloyl-ACP methyl ester carboxylesterase
MRIPSLSRRSLVKAAGAAGALALFAASACALAAPFASTRITVRTEGAGPDVVLIPGLNSSPRVWAEMVKAVPGYRYHLVQVAGFAGQPVGGNGQGPVAAPVAEEIARYIETTGIKQPAVIGHSMGGTIGMMLAARHPDVLSRLMVVDMVPFLGALFGGPSATAASVEPIADKFAAGMMAATPEERRARADQSITGMVNNEAMRPGALDDSHKSDPGVSGRAYRELIVTDLRAELPRIAVPMTVLYVLPKGAPMTDAQIDAVYKASYAPVKQVALKRIPDSAHFIMWDQPAQFQAEVKGFLQGK